MTMLQREMGMLGLLQLRSVVFDFVGVWKAVELVAFDLVVQVFIMRVSCFPGAII